MLETLGIQSTPTSIPGCYVLRLNSHTDIRGSFLKLYQKTSLEKFLPSVEIRDIYLTKSHHGVLRGLHFQVLPFDHVKIVTCISGAVHDVVLDLRPGEGFGKHLALQLSAEEPSAILIPRGCAHGFYVTGTHADLLYFVETEHEPQADKGILWSSAGIAWPIPKGSEPILSLRDSTHPPLKELLINA